MKWRLFLVACFLALIFTVGCTNNSKGISNVEEPRTSKSGKLTLDIVEILSKKGDKLSWEDFKVYDGKEIGSGLYIMLYPIDDNYEILIGGASPNEIPMYIYLVNKDTEKHIDIRHYYINHYKITKGTVNNFLA